MNGPDIEGVLGRHRLTGHDCPCGWKVNLRTTKRLGEWAYVDGPWAVQHNAHVAAELRAEVRAWLESVLDDGVTKSLPVAEWAADPLPSCPQYAHVNPDWLLAIIGEAKGMRAALAALAEQVGQVASVGEGEEGS